MNNVYVVTSESNSTVASWQNLGSNIQYIFIGSISSNTLISYLANTIADILLNSKGYIIFAPSSSFISNRNTTSVLMLSNIKQNAISTYKVDSNTFDNKVISSAGDENSILTAIGTINYNSVTGITTSTTTLSYDATTAKTPNLVITTTTDSAPAAFDEVKPTANSSNIVQKNEYSYYFGFDTMQVFKRDIKTDCAFISDYIDLDSNIDYITLSCNYNLSEFSSIEFFIIDGSNTVPILEENQKMVQKERIFSGILPTFPVDTSETIEIYKDNIITSLIINDAISKTDGVYTVTYTPTEGWKYKPKDDKIKIKVIMRLYDKYSTAPTVDKIMIKQFGGDTVWQASI